MLLGTRWGANQESAALVNRSIRCEHGFDRDCVACPECDEQSHLAHETRKANAQRRPQVFTRDAKRPERRAAARAARKAASG